MNPNLYNKSPSFIAGGMLTLCLLISGSAKTQNIVKEESLVRFEISNTFLNSVEGTFKGMEGSLKFTPDQLASASFDVCIDASTVDTENDKRDEHLQGEDFFDVKKYPTICFTSTSVSKDGDQYVAKGNLQMHGVSKEVTIPFTYKDRQFEGLLTINRQYYQVGQDTGTFLVGKEVEITIFCVTSSNE